MTRKPKVRERQRTIIENLNQLEILEENPDSLQQFILDALKNSDMIMKERISREQVRESMMPVYRDKTKIDIRSILNTQAQGVFATDAHKSQIAKFEEQVDLRLTQLPGEFGLLVVNVAIIDRSRSALQDIFNNKQKVNSRETLEDINEVYDLTSGLVGKLIDAYRKETGMKRKKNEGGMMDLNDLGTLVHWLQSFIDQYLDSGQKLYSQVYYAEEKTMVAFENHLPELIRKLLKLWERAREIFDHWLQRSKTPALPAGHSFYDQLERDSWRIAWDRMEHLHKALVRLLGELCQRPAVPLAKNINDLARWYDDMRRSEQQPTAIK